MYTGQRLRFCILRDSHGYRFSSHALPFSLSASLGLNGQAPAHTPSSPMSGRLKPEYGTCLNLRRRREHQSLPYKCILANWKWDVLNCEKHCAKHLLLRSVSPQSSAPAGMPQCVLKRCHLAIGMFLGTNGIVQSACSCGAIPSYDHLRASGFAEWPHHTKTCEQLPFCRASAMTSP